MARHSLWSWLVCGFCLTLFAWSEALPSASDEARVLAPFVSLDPSGKLLYRTTARGDRVVDFSYAGYLGGGVEPPRPPVLDIVRPSGGDETTAIQSAIDKLAKQTSASRPGALRLDGGVFHLGAALRLCANGLVLRGSGSDPDGTVLELRDAPHAAITTTGCTTRGTGNHAPTTRKSADQIGLSTTLAQTYVPSGAQSIDVRDVGTLHAGSTILIERPVTPNWLAFMGMDNLARAGSPETWLNGVLRTERIVQTVHGNTLILTTPLTDSYDPAYGGGAATNVSAIEPPVRLRQVGVEDLTIVSPALHIRLEQPHYVGVRFDDVEDGWMRNVHLREVTGAVEIGSSSRRITVEDIRYSQSVPIESAAKPFVFSVAGTQVLVQNVRGTANEIFYYATQSRMQGPNVLRDCAFDGNGRIEPHQRWATGLLVENCVLTGGGIDLQNRGEMGSGHGWPIGWSVLWNNRAPSFIVQNPPGALNWSIGNIGSSDRAPMPTYDGAPKRLLPLGTVESPGMMVEPRSLYREQLLERIGRSLRK